MSDPRRSAARRAERLLRCYPSRWRSRYGDEFTELLIDDISERPRSWVRTADVVRSGALARVAAAGLHGQELSPEQQMRAGLAWLCGALAAFLILGIALWSQLTIGWQWSAPDAPATQVAMIVMSAAFLGLAVLALLSALPLAWSLCALLVRREVHGLLRPLALTVAGAAVFALGSLHFGNGWPGTGGHQWAERGLVPGAVAQFCWAATLWVTSYWVHPGALSSFPALEIGWMVACPVALAATAVGLAKTLRRLPLSRRVLSYECWIGSAAAAAMAAFLAGAGSWVVSGGPAPRGLFRVGAIDGLGVAAMTVALVLAFRAVRRAVSASPGRRAES
ncbi:MAG: hypothetical protein M3Z06_04075 [Actinomycetota bacterium]|nr:hypothetical protein [Actinomycetota bacterium]